MKIISVVVGIVFLASSVCVWAESDPNKDDVQKALSNIRWAWGDHGRCSKVKLCATYFDEWGVNINFADGSVVPFAHIQRLTTSAHDCIQNAKNALQPDPLKPQNRALAVEWVMASQIHNPDLRNWMKSHPDAVLAALLSM